MNTPESWTTKKIKYCAKLSPSCDTSKLLSDSEVTFTPMECIRNGYFINRKSTFSALNSSYTQYQEGDIVIAKVTPCFENGNIAEMHDLYSGFGFGSSELFVLRPHGIESRFLFYVLQNEEFKEKGCATMTGTGGLKRVSPSFIENYYIVVPTVEEQKRVSAFLDSKCAEIDAVLEKTRASIEEYKKLKQSIITQAVTKGIRGDRPMKESGIEWIGEIPENWDVRRIKSIGIYRNGLTYEPQDQVDENEGVLVLRSSNVQNGKLDFSSTVFVSCNIPKQLMVQKGDILICSRNGSRELIGKNAIIDSNISASFGAFMMIFRCKCPKYMYYVLNSNVFSFYLNTFLTTTINQLTGKNFGNMNVVYCPDAVEQAEIISFLDRQCKGLDELIAKKVQLINMLEFYKKSLIYEYVTGKKEV